MASADRTNNTEQLQRFINNLWGHQQKKEFCDFTLTTNNTSIECHKLVLSSASSYFSQLLCGSEHNTNIVDVTPLPEHILRTVVAFMYNSEYVIDDENVIELLKFSSTWNLDILAQLCVAYMNDIVTINNACRFYNFALNNVDQHKSQKMNRFIRKHFTNLHETGQLSELSLKNFSTIIEHDKINLKNEDVIFSSAVQIINQQTSVEDINRCLELIRFPHTSGDFLVKVILNHPLMKEPPRDRYVSEALLYQLNKTSAPEVKPPRYWGRGIYYISFDCCVYQYVCQGGDNECVKMINLSAWISRISSVTSHGERVVIVGCLNDGNCGLRVVLLDMTDNIKVTQLPDLPEARYSTDYSIGVVLSDNDVYVVVGYRIHNSNFNDLSSSVYHLSHSSDAWQKKMSMPHPVYSPLVIKHRQCLYVLGGYNKHREQSSVSKYNIKDDTWKQCSDMPVACYASNLSWYVADVVVHEDRIKLITVDKCFIYEDGTDTWTAKLFSECSDKFNLFTRRGQIWAAVQQDNGTCSLMSYNDEDNVWKHEHHKIRNAMYQRSFHWSM